MPKYLHVIFVAAATVSTAATPAVAKPMPMTAKAAPARCMAASEAQVASQFTAFNAAWQTYDPAKVTALFARDAVLLATLSNTPRTTPEAINDYFVKFLQSKPVGSIDTSTVRIGCNVAYRMGTWTVKLTNAETGAVTDVKARYTFIYKPEGGTWKIEHLHSSLMPEPAA